MNLQRQQRDQLRPGRVHHVGRHAGLLLHSVRITATGGVEDSLRLGAYIRCDKASIKENMEQLNSSHHLSRLNLLVTKAGSVQLEIRAK